MTTTSTRPAATETETPAQLSATALRDLLERTGALHVLDVRTPGEFAAGHVPGSVNVPLDTLREHASTLSDQLPGEVPVVLVCRSGARASTAAQSLAEAGRADVQVLEGGVRSWGAAGGDLQQGEGPWDLERQVRLVAGGIVLTSVLASSVLPGAKWVAGGIGGGLTFAALSNTCAMGQVLMKMPWNRGSRGDVDRALSGLRTSGRAAQD